MGTKKMISGADVCNCGHVEMEHVVTVEPDAGPIHSPCTACSCEEFYEVDADE